MTLNERVLVSNGFVVDEDNDTYYKFVMDWSDKGHYYLQSVRVYPHNGRIDADTLVEAICGKEMCRVRTCSVERVNVILAMLKINFRVDGTKEVC